ESRYRQMTADALNGEQLIAMSLLQPGWEKTPNQLLPPIHSMVGLGQIVAHERLDDGRYMLVMRGLARARVIREELVELPYRIGRLELCHDEVPAQCDFDRRQRADEIVSLFCQLFPGQKFQQLVHQAMSVDLPLGAICDTIASTVPMASELSQQFLDELNPDVRSQMLWQLLQRATKNLTTAFQRPFPPSFSAN
ncbi:MAG: LON peptidase substrate-binding domain-containing protein, partial [Candidatus Saccharimonas sp.]|nr:LON peptidase substrate-binding domain-containing protein [Planctomycetaceae bacterium]